MGFAEGVFEEAALLVFEERRGGFGAGFEASFGSDELVRKVLDVDFGCVGEHAGAADDVLELADVAGPVVALEDDRGPGCKAFDGFVEVVVELADEVRDEERDVFAALVERGDGKLDHGEAVVKVFAETSVGEFRA